MIGWSLRGVPARAHRPGPLLDAVLRLLRPVLLFLLLLGLLGILLSHLGGGAGGALGDPLGIVRGGSGNLRLQPLQVLEGLFASPLEIFDDALDVLLSRV